MPMQGFEEEIHILDKKIAILKIKKQAQVHGYGKNEQQLPFFVGGALIHPFHEMKIEKGGCYDHKNEPGCTPTVEYNAGEQNDQVLVAFVCYEVKQEKGRQKIN
jgi:hypothetical protein